MPNTYELIKGETLTSSVSSYTFSAIASTYTDLVVLISARTDTAYGVGGIFVKINGATSTSSVNRLYTTTGTGVGTNTTSTSIWTYGLNTDSQTSNTFSNFELYLPNYASTSQNKPMSIFSVAENNATAAAVAASAALFSDNAAVSSLVFTSLGGDNFVAGSSFYLYGVKNA